MQGGRTGEGAGGRNPRVSGQPGGKLPALPIVQGMSFATNFPDMKGPGVPHGLLSSATARCGVSESEPERIGAGAARYRVEAESLRPSQVFVVACVRLTLRGFNTGPGVILDRGGTNFLGNIASGSSRGHRSPG